MSLESELKTRFIEQSRDLGAYARRIESAGFAVGILDMIVMYPEYRTFFIEAKIIKGLRSQPTERQWIEGQRIQKAGGTPILVGWDSDRNIYISEWTQAASTLATYKREGREYGKYFKEWIERTQLKSGGHFR